MRSHSMFVGKRHNILLSHTITLHYILGSGNIRGQLYALILWKLALHELNVV